MREMNAVDEKQIEAEENFVLDAQFLLQDLMAEHGISRAELSRRAGISKARISQLMKAGANPTLRNLAKLFYALGADVALARKTATRSDVASHHGLMPLSGRLSTSAEWHREDKAALSHPSRNEAVVRLIAQAKRRPNAMVAKANDNMDFTDYVRQYG